MLLIGFAGILGPEQSGDGLQFHGRSSAKSRPEAVVERSLTRRGFQARRGLPAGVIMPDGELDTMHVRYRR
jgi:hypothetical protein